LTSALDMGECCVRYRS